MQNLKKKCECNVFSAIISLEKFGLDRDMVNVGNLDLFTVYLIILQDIFSQFCNLTWKH